MKDLVKKRITRHNFIDNTQGYIKYNPECFKLFNQFWFP